MMKIKLQCGCGQKYAFEVEPVNGQMGVPVSCPACGTDGTATANQVIAQTLAEQQQEAPSTSPASGATVVAPAAIANPAPAPTQAPAAAPAPVARPVAAAPGARVPQSGAMPARQPVRPGQRPGMTPGNRPATAAAVARSPQAGAVSPKVRVAICVAAVLIFVSIIVQTVVSKGLFGMMSGELKMALTVAETQVNSMSPRNLDSSTRLDGATAGPGKRFTYKYTLLKQKAAEVNVGQWRQAVVPMLKRNVQASREMRPLFQNGVTVCYRYHGKDGVLVDEIVFNPSDVLGK